MKRALALLVLLAGPALAGAADVSELSPWLDSLSREDLRAQVAELPSPAATDARGRTLLHHAVCEAPDRVPLLLELGVDPRITDDNGASALHRLFRCGHPADDARLSRTTVRLLNAGALFNERDQRHRTPVHAAVAGMPEDSGRVNHYRDAAALMLARGAEPGPWDRKGITPLHLAARKSSAALVDWLIQMGASVDKQDDRGRSALWYASAGRHNLGVFEALLRHNADPGLTPEQGPSPIRRAAASQAWQKVHLLLELDPDAQLPEEPASRTLAQALWENVPLPVARGLTEAGAAPGKLHQYGGGDLAWRLAEQGQPGKLDWLLEQGFELNRLPDSGYPPLFFASTEATRLLLERGADPALASAENGTPVVAFIKAPERFRTPEPHYTREKVNRLLDAGYPVNHRDRQDKTALERAVAGNRLWLVERLLDAGADPTLTSGEGASVIPLALDTGRLPLIRTLIRSVPDFRERHADLLLHYIKDGGRDRAVAELLLLQGLDPDRTDAEGNTALHWAARRQAWKLTRLLLDNGADPSRVNASGCSLRCYQWRMPGSLQQRLNADAADSNQFRGLRLSEGPVAFFALAFSPALALYLLVVGWRLYRHQSLLRPTLDLAITLPLVLILASTLFYDCRPCLLPAPWQLPATTLLSLLLLGALLFRPARTTGKNAQQEY
jgi:ankyrin repeat protein